MNNTCLTSLSPYQSDQDIYTIRDYPHIKETLQTELKWYAVQTYSCREKAVDKSLKSQGIHSFLPLLAERRKWSDRIKTIHVPLFPGYLFVHMGAQGEDCQKIIYTHNVCRIVGDRTGPAAIPDHQITAISSLIQARIPLEVARGLQRGQTVKVKSGLLQGVEGEFISRGERNCLAIYIPLLGQMVLAMVDADNMQILE